MRSTALLAAAFPLALALAGCQTSYDSLAFGPALTPVGNGLDTTRQPVPVAFQKPEQKTFRSTYDLANSQSMYRDLRASKVGDVIRVSIAIDDKAQFDNATDRSRKSKTGLGVDAGLDMGGFGKGVNAGALAGNLDINSDTSTKGKGTIDRSEKLRLSIAVVVTEVLPNGNLVISGSQEILVNYEVRVLNIGGIVNPLDVSANNIIPYDKIAEARISYGGRGRSMDVQQPAWGQRIYDLVVPF
ncbi:flagellar basal body L-ring protein FlgH [Aquabacter sp. P-9]|uniref:flagellar basal body L-ring protein FlgH n=1 Tax=Aquabacter sediminis TaxID=3029197 RepID=UPI00237EC0FF|nr:flagellar basal body L-ring protein FlgH [Aquabacter sp. P-9]MDE1568684.1 flagellar basal body L-ring protein FlgH [Aquabacter sp. P-9]